MSRRFLSTVSSTVLLALLAGWLGDLLKGDSFFGLPRPHWLDSAHLVIIAVILVLAMIVAFWLARNLEGITLRQANSVETNVRAEGLLLMISRPTNDQVPRLGNFASIAEALADAGFRAHNWSQLLRGLQPHVATLKRCVLVTTTGSRGSDPYGQAACDLVRRFLPAGVDVVLEPGFHRLKSVPSEERFRKIVEAMAKFGCAPGAIVIDITGGTKTMTVAGALATLANDAQYQYVDATDDDDYKVRYYDLRADARR